MQYKSFENTVGKGEIARNQQFLLFPTVFSIPFGKLSTFLIILDPLPNDKILDWSKLKQNADNILKCIQNEK